MTLLELLALVTAELDAIGIPHMVAGSIASTYYGEPRATQDIDIVIDPDPQALSELVRRLSAAGFYVGDAAAALERRDQFNVVDPRSGWKVDLIIRKERPFSREEFARRRRADLGGSAVSIATAEDVILAKLDWARATGSDRQLRDVVSIFAVSGDRLDLTYLRRWADELDLGDRLEDARRGAHGPASD